MNKVGKKIVALRNQTGRHKTHRFPKQYFSSNMKLIMEIAALNAVQIARIAGCTSRQAQRWMYRETMFPSSALVLRLSDFFEIPIRDLLVERLTAKSLALHFWSNAKGRAE